VGYKEVVQSDRPVALWPLDDSSGTTARDVSGNGRTFTWGSAPSFGAGVGSFRGIKDSGTVEGTLSSSGQSWFGSFLQNGGYEAWIITTATAIQAVQDCRWGSNTDATLYCPIGASGVLQGNGNNSGNTSWSIVGSKVINDGKLHHVALGWGGPSTTALKLWVDGVLDATGTSATSVGHTSATDMKVCGENGIREFNGSIAWAGCFSAMPTDDRIRAHYLAGIGHGFGPGWAAFDRRRRGR
jgi:hypothetical protein